jgi:sulfate/thiosulfate transport system substrate-binding protein
MKSAAMERDASAMLQPSGIVMRVKYSATGASALALGLVAAAIGLLAFKHHQGADHDVQVRLLNVSYDPTRELYAQLNPRFVAEYRKETGESVGIEQSHGGSSRQARLVAEGALTADVVTLALPSDIDRLRVRKMVVDDWQSLFPNHSQPYYSTIVFVVRKGNPKNIHQWVDLADRGIEVVTPSPVTSGNGKLSMLAAWGSVINRGGTEAQALDLVTRIYRNVSNPGEGARDSTTTFELAKEGDVQLTWENEAIREVAESRGDLDIVYPAVSIRAEPSVAVVTTNVSKHHTEAVARAYLNFLFSDDAQELLAEHGYRPANDDILKRHQDLFPKIALFPVTTIASDWVNAQEKFFGDNGLFNSIHAGGTN